MPTRFFEPIRRALIWTLLALACASTSLAQTDAAPPPAPPAQPAVLDTASSATNGVTTPNDPITRIREEGLKHSQVMQILEHLTEEIGPRLTGSPSLKRANEWTRDELKSWCLANAHLEAWGPFGRGWSLKRFSAAIVEPQYFPLVGCPNAWSPGLNYPLVADVVYLDVKTNADLEAYKGKLKGAVVLISPPRELTTRFEPMATLLSDTNLLSAANAGPPPPESGGLDASQQSGTNRSAKARGSRSAQPAASGVTNAPGANTTRVAARPPPLRPPATAVPSHPAMRTAVKPVWDFF